MDSQQDGAIKEQGFLLQHFRGEQAEQDHVTGTTALSGGLMIQARIPGALGIFFPPWNFDSPLLVSGVITALAIVFLWRLFRRSTVNARALTAVIALFGVYAILVTAYYR